MNGKIDIEDALNKNVTIFTFIDCNKNGFMDIFVVV